jgi:mono/diheme cytochrome c family protein
VKVRPLNRISTRFAIAAAATLSLIHEAHAADADRGRALARQWCASCHAIDAAATTRDTPPSFVVIARRPGVSEASLRAWLLAPHPSMPDFELSRATIEDLVAYIRSLGPPGR